MKQVLPSVHPNSFGYFPFINAFLDFNPLEILDFQITNNYIRIRLSSILSSTTIWHHGFSLDKIDDDHSFWMYNVNEAPDKKWGQIFLLSDMS